MEEMSELRENRRRDEQIKVSPGKRYGRVLTAR
jgi:hypothetical protein